MLMLIGTAVAIAAVPALSLIVLIVTGAASVFPALAALVVVALAALALAAVWVGDLGSLAETLRAAEQDDGVTPNSLNLARAAAAPRLPAVERIARGIERLARTLAARAAQVGQLLRANEAIVESLPDPLLVVGADRIVRRANAAARVAFGADMRAVMRHPGLRTAIDRVLELHTPQTGELQLAVPVPRELQATVIWLDPPLADGGVVLAVLSDRTRERAAERTRADFVANASHELRTPLASLIGFIDTLRGPAADDPPAQARFLTIMAEQAYRMNRLIDDLLSLSRIELTEHQAPSDRVDLGAVAIGIAESFEPRVKARGLTLATDVAPNLPRVMADRDQMMQVVQNLVDNAVKYGRDKGNVRVAVKSAQPGGRYPARPGLLLSVSDDGPGIPRSQIPRLTERFYRVDKGRSRQAGGTGLGLAIVKHIVNRHRGHLLIESDEGAGATFSVWLPSGSDT